MALFYITAKTIAEVAKSSIVTSKHRDNEFTFFEIDETSDGIISRLS
jgi:hypothetical protein